MDSSIKIALILGAIALASSGDSTVSNKENTQEEESTLRSVRERELLARLEKSGAKPPPGGWTFSDALFSVKDLALDVRRGFKENEAALTLLIGAIGGPEAVAVVQAGDSFIDWLLDSGAP